MCASCAKPGQETPGTQEVANRVPRKSVENRSFIFRFI
jgi:hypothetical protein